MIGQGTTGAAVVAAAATAGKRQLTILIKNDFESLGVGGKFRRALRDVGYEQPTPIQSQAIPHLLRGMDLLGIAQTGTGKTAAFVLPLLQRLDGESSPPRPGRPRALVLAPTRELALQIHEELATLGRHTSLRHAFIIGGVGQNPQVRALARGLDVLVATPGRLLDLAAQRHVDLSEVSVLVLDEADRLLDMGFVRDVKRIVAQTPETRQSLLFSATMPQEVATLAREILDDPVRIDVSPKQMTVKEIDQRVVMVGNGDKQRMLEHLLQEDEVSRAIVFTRTKHGANKVARKLEGAGIGAEAIHGNKSQNARQRALQNFKNGDARVLVATDIAARGIDIDAVSHVFNYELPHEPESYVHRIGRTGRAGAAGAAWSLVDPSERSRLLAVERLIRFSPAEVTVELPPRDSAEPSGRHSRDFVRSPGNQKSGTRRRARRRRRQPAG
ncbi:MAG: DEAD/DEAH box helicase [Myxococcales bacterium]|nr:DEAD/DEAH box helicase [Myxococcales bacterium]